MTSPSKTVEISSTTTSTNTNDTHATQNVDDNTGFAKLAKEAALHSADVLHKPLAFLAASHVRGVRQYLREKLAQDDVYIDINESLSPRARNVLTFTPTLKSPSVLAVDLAQAARQVLQFRKHLPSITIHYALKSFPDLMLAVTLARLGVYFDCASADEMQLAIRALRYSSLPSSSSSSTTYIASSSSDDGDDNDDDDQATQNDTRIIFANPIKRKADLKYARSMGVRRVTVDCVEELHKLKEVYPSARAILRIATDDSSSSIPLSVKFGAQLTEVHNILTQAQQLKIDVIGIAFHVGSGAQSVQPFINALRDARSIFDLARKQFGYHMHVLDIGGGFPAFDGQAKVTFVEIAQCISLHVHELFGHLEQLQVLAEPGRFICASAADAATRVERCVSTTRNGQEGQCKRRYILADGIYGLFRDAWMFGERFIPQVLLRRAQLTRDDDTQINITTCLKTDLHYNEPDVLRNDGDNSSGNNLNVALPDEHHATEMCDLLGVSMEVGDVVTTNVALPPLNRGDWVIFENMGSYTLSLSTKRTDLPQAQIVYLFCDGVF